MRCPPYHACANCTCGSDLGLGLHHPPTTASTPGPGFLGSLPQPFSQHTPGLLRMPLAGRRRSLTQIRLGPRSPHASETSGSCKVPEGVRSEQAPGPPAPEGQCPARCTGPRLTAPGQGQEPAGLKAGLATVWAIVYSGGRTLVSLPGFTCHIQSGEARKPKARPWTPSPEPSKHTGLRTCPAYRRSTALHRLQNAKLPTPGASHPTLSLCSHLLLRPAVLQAGWTLPASTHTRHTLTCDSFIFVPGKLCGEDRPTLGTFTESLLSTRDHGGRTR